MKLSGCHFDCRPAAIGGSRSSQFWGALDSASREAHTRFAGFAAPKGGGASVGDRTRMERTPGTTAPPVPSRGTACTEAGPRDPADRSADVAVSGEGERRIAT